MTGPGVYSYVTSGVPDPDIYIGYVTPNGHQTITSIVEPTKVFTRPSINSDWTRVKNIGVGESTEGTGEIFNNYANNIAHSDHAHAEGNQTKASWNSHSEGFQTSAGVDDVGMFVVGNCHAEGNGTKALGNESHAEGLNTEASGHHSHAEGEATVADNYNAHAEGYRTIASGNGSHAEGNSDGLSEGEYNEASGFASHVEGRGTKAINSSEHAEGILNVSESNYIHSVGIGTIEPLTRKNAHTITIDGKHYIYGLGDYDGTTVIDKVDLVQYITNLENRVSTLETIIQTLNERLTNLENTEEGEA